MIYLDYHATTPVDRRVADRIHHYMTEEFGNASSTDHEWGDRAEAAIQQVAQQVTDLIGASPREIVWTSGATERINLAIQGSLAPNPTKPYRIGLMAIEHNAVLDTCRALEKSRSRRNSISLRIVRSLTSSTVAMVLAVCRSGFRSSVSSRNKRSRCRDIQSSGVDLPHHSEGTRKNPFRLPSRIKTFARQSIVKIGWH